MSDDDALNQLGSDQELVGAEQESDQASDGVGHDHGGVAAASGASERDGHGYMEPGMPVWRSATLRQTLFAEEFRDIDIREEIPDGQGGWLSKTYSKTASFDVMRLACAKKDVFAFAGFDPTTGDLVIQRWKLKALKFQLAPIPIGGGPIPPVFINKAFRIAEIYRGPLAPEIRAFEFDAEARFVLALLDDGMGTATLYSFDNVVNATPVVLSDSNAVPELAEMNHMKKFDHSQVGRLWRLDDHPIYEKRVFLVDFDNDGFFDGPPTALDRLTWEASGLDDYSYWNSLMGP